MCKYIHAPTLSHTPGPIRTRLAQIIWYVQTDQLTTYTNKTAGGPTSARTRRPSSSPRARPTSTAAARAAPRTRCCSTTAAARWRSRTSWRATSASCTGRAATAARSTRARAPSPTSRSAAARSWPASMSTMAILLLFLTLVLSGVRSAGCIRGTAMVLSRVRLGLGLVGLLARRLLLRLVGVKLLG